MSFKSKYILVKNIPLSYQESTVETTLRSFLESRQEIFGNLKTIKISRNEIEECHRAYITYYDTNTHGEIVRYLHNMYILGAYIDARNIFMRFRPHILFNPNEDILYCEENRRIPGRMVFTDFEGEYWDVFEQEPTDSQNNHSTRSQLISVSNMVLPSINIQSNEIANTEDENMDQLNSRINNLQLTDNNPSSRLNASSMHRSFSQHDYSSQINSIFSVPTSSNLTLNTNVAEIYADAMRSVNAGRSVVNTRANFKCIRCKIDFGQSQISYEAHVPKCLVDEKLSLSVQIREAKCMLCLKVFEQTSTENFRFLPCGHFLHTDCFVALIENRIKTCPLCRVAIPANWKGMIYLN